MPMTSVTLRPGVDTQRTLALNEAGVSISNLIRYKQGLIQKIGGWNLYYNQTISSTIREIWGWQDSGSNQHLAVGATAVLDILTAGSASNITPQTNLNNPLPDFSISSGSNVVTVVDALSSATVFDTVYFNTPVAVGNLLLNGAYQINTVGGSSTYTIISSIAASTTLSHVGTLPVFSISSGSALVTVTLPNNNFLKVPGLYYPFIAPTTIGASLPTVVQGSYQINSIIDSTTFTIVVPSQASTTATATMNASFAQLLYYIAIGPPQSGGGYGLGMYGLGGYGMGSGATAGSGTPITATDWTMGNWGDILLAVPKDGPVYAWAPAGGFTTAQVVATAPFFNGGMLISQPQQILVLWRSTLSTGVQSPLIVRWSNQGDYTNFVVSAQTTAGSFTIPTGSRIIGGLQGPTQALIWTDVDAWAMQYVGGVVVFNFTRVGTGCGLLGVHAAGVIAGQFFWAGVDNFYTLGPSGVAVVPCTVWDFFFQQIDRTQVSKVRCAINSMFNEITWYFPVTGGTGENTAYVKLNLLENEWDYGFLARTAWIDVTALGNPIGTDTGTIFQHEIGEDNVNTPINGVFESGYWEIAEGNQMAFVDWCLPDMRFGTYGTTGANLSITFKAVDYAGDTPRVYGPFAFSQSTEFLAPRLRGRFMSIRVESNDVGSFWRIGRVKYRWSPAGRR